MKDGGAKVRALHTPMPNDLNGTPENWRGRLLHSAKVIAEQGSSGSQIDGFIVIGLFEDGKSSIGYRIPQRIPECLIPAYVAELIRRDTVVEHEAARTFDSKFEWVE